MSLTADREVAGGPGLPAGAPQQLRATRSRRRQVLRAVGPPAVALGLLVLTWYLLHLRLGEERRFLLPSPHQTIRGGFLEAEPRGEILDALLLTARLAFTGLAIAVAIGVVLAAVMVRFRWLERAAYPYLVALQAVPILAVVPLLVVAFGDGFTTKVITCVVISFFPIPTNLLLGMTSVDRGLLDLFRLSGAGWWTQLRKLALPAAMPAFFTALRISAGLSVIGAVVGEMFFQRGEPGLGNRLLEYRQRLRYEELFSTVIVSSLLGIAVFVAFGRLADRALRSWHESAQAR